MLLTQRQRWSAAFVGILAKTLIIRLTLRERQIATSAFHVFCVLDALFHAQTTFTVVWRALLIYSLSWLPRSTKGVGISLNSMIEFACSEL